MSAGHTAGPWDEVDLFIVTASDSVICKLGGWDEEYADEQAANARLIAAAPELLASLIEMTRAWDHIKDANLVDGSSIRVARAAIRKATGETA